MLLGLKFISKLSLEKMLSLAGESNFDFIVIGKKGKSTDKEKELLSSYTLTILEEKEKGLLILEKINKEEIQALAKQGKNLKIALLTEETKIKKLKSLRGEFETLFFGKEYVEKNKEYLGGY